MALALPRQYLRALNRQRRGDRTRWHAPSRPVGPATSQHDGGRAIRERAAYLMGVVLREPSATDPVVELVRELYAQPQRVAGAWRGARECAARRAAGRGRRHSRRREGAVWPGQADRGRIRVLPSGRAAGAYEMARTIRDAFPDEDAFARAYLEETVSTAHRGLRCTSITITSISQLGEVAGAYARAAAAGWVGAEKRCARVLQRGAACGSAARARRGRPRVPDISGRWPSPGAADRSPR
jgi:hypothetical protein